MSFTISPDVTPVLSKLMQQRVPLARSRDGKADSRAIWSSLNAEVGLAGLCVAERHGGQGATLRELGAAAYEAGRVGWSGPLIPTAGVTAVLLRLLDPDDETGLQRGLCSGERLIAAALHEDDRGVELTFAASCSSATGTAAVSGRKTFVDSGSTADTFLVPATGPGGDPVIVVVPADGAGVQLDVMTSVDPGRGLAMLTLDRAAGTVMPTTRNVPEALGDAYLVGALLAAADATGAAGQCLDLSTSYATTREQFGRAIATFQSIKHKLVDMLAELETARSAVSRALDSASGQHPDWRFEASAAKVRASDAAMYVAREAVQVHGGIGFTFEHDLSHHFRRITALRAVYGTPTEHRARVAANRGF